MDSIKKTSRTYSIIIPVYNRPDEIDELLESLTHQLIKNFEVIIVEDGSNNKCDHVVEKYIHELNIQYLYKKNEGQGFARNYGYERAKGDYLIVFDSDCIIPPDYLKIVDDSLNENYLDAYGGPDRSHPTFTKIQKAIDYSMTSVLTTGGIRGSKHKIGPYHPRSFNMGISRKVFETTHGYIIPFKGEDIEFSIRINKLGFKTGLIQDAFVYHKRRISWTRFFKQLHFFGTARINISRFFPEELKLVHLFPSFFTIGLLIIIVFYFIYPPLSLIGSVLYLLYFISVFLHATWKTRSLIIGFLSVWAVFIQLTAYGSGLLIEYFIKLFKG